MSEPFIGEIQLMSFDFPPKGWAACDGRLLEVKNHVGLFGVIGYTYGGSGLHFAVPNLEGRAVVSQSEAYPFGSYGGQAEHTLTTAELASHTHLATGTSDPASIADPTGARWATTPRPAFDARSDGAMSTAAIGGTGGGAPHPNLPPFLVLYYAIALEGIFPSR